MQVESQQPVDAMPPEEIAALTKSERMEIATSIRGRFSGSPTVKDVIIFGGPVSEITEEIIEGTDRGRESIRLFMNQNLDRKWFKK